MTWIASAIAALGTTGAAAAGTAAAGTAAAGLGAGTAAGLGAGALGAGTAAAAAPALAGTAGALGAAAAPAAAGATGAAGLGGAGGGMMAAGAPTGLGVFGTATPAVGGSVTPAGLGSGAIGTGFTGPELAASGNLAPAAGGFGPGVGAGSGVAPGASSSPGFFDQVSGMYDKVTNHPAFKTGKEALDMASSFNSTFGPNGSAQKGDLSGMMKGAEGMMGNAKNIGALWNPSSSTTGKPGSEVGSLGTTQSAFGLSPEQFSSIPPEVKQEMLRKLGGR